MTIYLITNLVTGKVYVGQTISSLQHRLNGHFKEARTGTRYRLHNSIRKHGESKFKIEWLASATSKEQLDGLERLFIILLRSSDCRYGYNLTLGGDGSHGYKHSEETRRRMHKPHRRGWHQTLEHRLARADAW